MKKLIIITSLFYSHLVFGQMTIDLGNDTVFCANNDSILMGANLVISQGAAPYTYSWWIPPYTIPFLSYTF